MKIPRKHQEAWERYQQVQQAKGNTPCLETFLKHRNAMKSIPEYNYGINPDGTARVTKEGEPKPPDYYRGYLKGLTGE